MKTSFRIACIAALACVLWALDLAPNANAQTLPGFGGQQALGGGGIYEPGAFTPAQADFQLARPGRVWVSTNIADEGLGFSGTYATIGAKTRLFEDALDGRWLIEGRGHVSTESGGFFGNLGIERVFSIDAAGADVSLSGWIDYDDDQQGSFAHSFFAWGVSGAIKTRRWDILGSGYFPEGSTTFTQGDPNGVDCFLNHGIVLQAGIDSALQGFDVTLRTRPKALRFLNGSIDFGGYGYESDVVEYFGGGRGRLNIQLLAGLSMSAELNYDERFDATGSLNFTWTWGASQGRGSEYAGLARDLERTSRNDHIVRFNQEVVLAIDPDTGRPYNVFHVDNTADVNFEEGTVELPFTTLAQAEAASGEGDIIFVREGDGTTRGLDTGINLQDDQLLLGDGVAHVIPVQNGQNFLLCNDLNGVRPNITGQDNGSAISLANNNVVRGFEIDGAAASGGLSFGISGFGTTENPITNGIIEDTDISGAILHGVFVDKLAGDWNFARNDIQDNGFDGILLEHANDPTSIFNFEENIVSNNGRDGIHLREYDAQQIVFQDNETDGNNRNGVFLEGFKNQSGNGLDLTFLNHQAINNLGNGIEINGGDGAIMFLNSQITGNIGSGILVVDWTNNDPTDQTFIGTINGGTSNILGNGAGDAGIDILQRVGPQTVTITDSTVNGNGIGIRGRSELTGNLNVNVVDNLSVSNNLGDGLQFVAVDGGFLSVLVDQERAVPAQLPITGNTASGINFIVGSEFGGATSTIEAIVRNSNIDFNGTGVTGIVNQDGFLNLLVEDSTASNNLVGFNFNLNTNANGLVNTIVLDNITATDNAFEGLITDTFGGTFTDLVVRNSAFTNTLMEVTGGINSNGISITANGNAAAGNPQIDNRTRVLLEGLTVDMFTLAGIDIVGNGDANILAIIEGNTITNNGIGFLPPLGPELPFFDGLQLTSNGASRIDTRINNNIITGNFEQAVDLTANDSGTINAVMSGNNLAFNDVGEDMGNGVPDSNIADFNAFNNNDTLNSTICLSMSSNFFGFGVGIANALPNAPSRFILELDGLTNGFGPGAGANTQSSPFGSTCEALVAAQEAAFSADGFPSPDP